jgi:hypothetical protein
VGVSQVQFLRETFLAVNSTSVFGIVWVVPCVTRNPNGQEIENMKFVLNVSGFVLAR